MFTQLRIKNFKSWADTGDLRIAPLTGFFGANSSGKTSLLQMLLMLKQTAESSDRRQVLFTGDKNSLVDLGTYYDLIHNHQLDKPLEVSLSWGRSTRQPPGERSILEKPITLNFAIYEKSGRLVVNQLGYREDERYFGLKKREETNDEYELEVEGVEIDLDKEQMKSLSKPIKFYGFPRQIAMLEQRRRYSLLNLSFEFERQLSRIYYLGPLREYPQRSYLWSGSSPGDVGRKGENVIAALLAARIENRPLEQHIAEWMQKMGLVHSFNLAPIAPNRRDYEVRIRKTANSAEVLLTDVGFGVSQILPVLVLCYYVPKNSTVILEQPEIHLHPAVQSALADVFIEVVKERNVQLIFESHSEYLLRRIQRRIAEEKIVPQDTAMYFCTMGETASQIEPLDIDTYGNIRNWPKDFFGDEMGDLVKMTEAAMQRQLNG